MRAEALSSHDVSTCFRSCFLLAFCPISTVDLRNSNLFCGYIQSLILNLLHLEGHGWLLLMKSHISFVSYKLGANVQTCRPTDMQGSV